MSKDRSLQNIDVTKLLIYILVFISACLIMIFGFLVPNIQEYKRIKYDNRAQSAASTQINQVYNGKQETLDKLKSDNKAALDAFENKFDEGKFVTFVSQYLDSVVSKNSNISQSEPFLINELKITATIKTPSRLYDFIDALRSYENVVKIDFPIEMQKDGDKISAAFNVKIYGLR